MIQVIINLFALIGLFTTVFIFVKEPEYKHICEYKNNYSFIDHRECLMKNGCGSDGSLCPDEYTPQFCPEPTLDCKLVKNYDL